MRSDMKTYEAVAFRCDSFSPIQGTSTVTNSTRDNCVSCTNCSHFTNDKYCELDLYDQIVETNNLDA